MELHIALKNIILTEGRDIIKDLKAVNILDDFNAYKDMPCSRYILKAIIIEGYASKILELNKWDNNATALIQRFVNTTGFAPNSVNIIFESIAYGLGLLSSVSNNNTQQSPTPVNNPAPNNNASELMLTSTKLNKKSKDFLNDYIERAEEYLDSIVEYKEDFEQTLGLKIKVHSNYQVYANPTAHIEWKIEVEGDITLAKGCIICKCFDVVIYNQKGKIVGCEGAYIHKDIKGFGIASTATIDEEDFKSVGNIGKIIVISGDLKK